MSTASILILGFTVSAQIGAATADSPEPPAQNAVAGRTDGASPYRLDSFADATAIIGLAAAYVGTNLARLQRPFTPQCTASGPMRCDPKDLYGFDRYAVGKKSSRWLLASDITQFSGVLLPYIIDAIVVARSDGGGLSDWATDAAVILEAELAAGLVVHILKAAINRPRPRQYNPDTYRAKSTDQDSFASGHAVATTTGLTALAVTWWLRHADSTSRYWVAGLVAVTALVGSWARVEAGQHFPSDVLTGMALGALSGALIPWMHRVELAPRIGVAAGGAGNAGLTLAWEL